IEVVVPRQVDAAEAPLAEPPDHPIAADRRRIAALGILSLRDRGGVTLGLRPVVAVFHPVDRPPRIRSEMRLADEDASERPRSFSRLYPIIGCTTKGVVAAARAWGPRIGDPLLRRMDDAARIE